MLQCNIQDIPAELMEQATVRQIYLDHGRITSYAPDVEHEYRTAIADLLEENYFRLERDGAAAFGPYALHLSVAESRLIMEVRALDGGGADRCERVVVPMTPFRSIIRDYFHICENYYRAVRQSTPSQIETMDMAKRTLHNEGATLVQSLLKPEINVDFSTARRLFTLVCVLHVR